MFAVEITGESELAEALKGLPARLSKEAAFDAMVIALQPLIGAAKAYAPVETGSLRRSIGFRIARYQRGMKVFGIVGPRRGFGTDADHEPANYAHLVEFGHRINRGKKTLRKGGASSGEVPPHPFLRPAWDATKDEVLEVLEREFGMRVEAAARARRGGAAA